MYLIILEQLFIEALLDLFYFPLWWYSGGLRLAIKKVYEVFEEGNARLAPWVWIVNIFVPMYGQYDWEGRIISFVMRIVQIIFRTIALLAWSIICLFLLSIWLLFPVAVVSGIIGSLIK